MLIDGEDVALLSQQIEKIKAGQVIAFPTDTVYGLGVAFHAPEADERLFSLKHRTPQKALSVYVSSIEELEVIAQIPLGVFSKKIAKNFLPGPLTLITKHKNPRFPQKTLGFRIVKHPLVKKIIKEVGPLLATSANLSGYPSAVSLNEVKEDFPQEDIVLIPGTCSIGLESTVINPDEGIIYREGVISVAEIEAVLGKKCVCLSKEFAFKQHLTIHVVKNITDLHSFLSKRPDFQGVVCKQPLPLTFYPILRQTLQSSSQEVVFVYDFRNTEHPILARFLGVNYDSGYAL